MLCLGSSSELCMHDRDSFGRSAVATTLLYPVSPTLAINAIPSVWCLTAQCGMQSAGISSPTPQAAMVMAGDKSHKSIRGLFRALLANQTPRVLGQGAFGVVKAVKISGTDDDFVAVKTLKSDASPSETICFQREKEILQKLEHE